MNAINCKVGVEFRELARLIEHAVEFRNMIERDGNPRQVCRLNNLIGIHALTPELARGLRDISSELMHIERKAS